jgi:hypothetical protein
MKSTEEAVAQWRQTNAHLLVDCRWGCKITIDACRRYQSRTSRNILHFNGDRDPTTLRVNADYLRCFLPIPCPHAISDAEQQKLRDAQGPLYDGAHRERLARVNQERYRERLVNPEMMVGEADWHRSLIGR